MSQGVTAKRVDEDHETTRVAGNTIAQNEGIEREKRAASAATARRLKRLMI